MKFVCYRTENKAEKIGVLSKDDTWVFPLKAAEIEYDDMQTLIAEISDSELERLNHLSGRDPHSVQNAVPLSEVRLLSPVGMPDQDVICLGLNYADHVVESAGFDEDLAGVVHKDKACYFSKRLSVATTTGDPIPAHRDIVTQLDYESELCVIIRRPCRNVKPSEVRDYIFGYTIMNDVSARNLQTTHGQWFFGKSLDGFTPMGPAILTADSTAWPPVLGVRSYVNGELRQNSDTAHFIHSIAEIVSELSQGMTLAPGTIIATGTPSGVGMGFKPPKFLVPGDVVTCEIEGIGRLTNRVED